MRANAEVITAELRDNFMGELEAKYPGVSWSVEGGGRESRDPVSGLIMSFPAAMMGIFVVLATIFRSYVQPLVIMVTVPFGILGAVFGHMLLGINLAMFSIFGMMALTGVVVNDAIVLIEAINRLIAKGTSVFDAICRGGVRRFRAILLTTLSTVGGLLPIILERDSQAQIVIPMALSLAAGVGFATVLTLVLVPCLFAILNDARRILYWVLYRRFPSREEVEPARLRALDPLAGDVGAFVPAK